MRGSSNERVVQYERRVHLRCMYFWVTLAFWRAWCIGCVQADGSWAELCFHGVQRRGSSLTVWQRSAAGECDLYCRYVSWQPLTCNDACGRLLTLANPRRPPDSLTLAWVRLYEKIWAIRCNSPEHVCFLSVRHSRNRAKALRDRKVAELAKYTRPNCSSVGALQLSSAASSSRSQHGSDWCAARVLRHAVDQQGAALAEATGVGAVYCVTSVTADA